jgi:hypothetical protein
MGGIMNESRITVDGVPLEDALAVEQSNEIALHVKNEAKRLAAQCGVRRCSSTPHQRLGRPGRPRRAASLTLLAELEPYLRDESCLLTEIADLFGLSMNDLKFYQRRLAILRKRGRKCRSYDGRVLA